MGDSTREPLMDRSTRFQRTISHAQDELHSFRTYLRWMCVDQSNIWTTTLSWFLFIVLGLAVPCLSHFFLACSSCDAKHARPYDWVVQLSLSSVSTMSFVCLTRFVKKYGLKRFLFFDKLCNESEIVRKGYTAQLNVSSVFIRVFALISGFGFKFWKKFGFYEIIWIQRSIIHWNYSHDHCFWLISHVSELDEFSAPPVFVKLSLPIYFLPLFVLGYGFEDLGW